MHAEKVQKKAARVGFDWDDASAVFAKLHEEIFEIEEAVKQGQTPAIEEEIGDLLFTVVNFARKMKIDSEISLRQSNGKFTRRFKKLETILNERGQKFQDLDLEALDKIWDEIKAVEKI